MSTNTASRPTPAGAAPERFEASASAVIGAPAARAYALIADYRDGHPRILPPRAFRSLVVEQGGYGAGTVIRFEMVAFGRVRTARSTVREPEPGRVVHERIDADDIDTTFTVDPLSEATCRVTIATRLRDPRGPFAWLERRLMRGYLESVYREELARLDAAAREPARR